ncbi:cylicin-1-like, partial [Poecilia latipinna]|uniref:cylicin-1-like n=1 Tax=Poecilia latipinna TaxID=48699 RepID=UPI00072E2B46
MVEDQAEIIENDIHTNETAIGEVLQVIEEETVSTAQQNGDHQDEIKRPKKSKRKIKRKAAARDASELKTVGNENISGENIEKEVSVPEIVGDQVENIENEIHTNETAIGEVLQVIEEETVSTAQQNGDHQDEKKRSKKSKRKRKAATKDASELKAVNDEDISGENIEKEVSVPEIVGDQAETIENEINTNETAICEVLQVIEEETVSITQQYGDHQDEKKRSKKSKRKIKRKAATRDASDLKAVNEENISGENIEKEVSVQEIVGDQAETIENKIHTNETAIGEVLQVIEEETVSTAQQNGDQKDEKKRSTKSKRKIKRKAATKDASDLKAVNDEDISGENIEKEVSVPEIVGDQAETIENEINTNETAICEVLQVIEEETVSTAQQNGDPEDEIKRSKKSKRKRKAATRDASDLKAVNDEDISGENIEKEVSVPEIVGDQAETIENEINTNETAICEVLQVIEEETVSTAQQYGD